MQAAEQCSKQVKPNSRACMRSEPAQLPLIPSLLPVPWLQTSEAYALLDRAAALQNPPTCPLNSPCPNPLPGLQTSEAHALLDRAVALREVMEQQIGGSWKAFEDLTAILQETGVFVFLFLNAVLCCASEAAAGSRLRTSRPSCRRRVGPSLSFLGAGVHAVLG